MICYKDMTFCSAAPMCKNREGCFRYLTPEDKERADAWAGVLPVTPIAFADFSDTCPKYEEELSDG